MSSSNETIKVQKDGSNKLLLTRRFQAPKNDVFQALTDASIVKQWMDGPGGHTMTVCEIDLKPGGESRYEWVDQDGETMGLSSVFVEFHKPDRIVHIEEFDNDWTDGKTVVITELDSEANNTIVTMNIEYQSQKTRDAVLETDMTAGMEHSFSKLDELLD